jgi:hypothetical protein
MFHDPTLDRTTTGTGLIREQPWKGVIECVDTQRVIIRSHTDGAVAERRQTRSDEEAPRAAHPAVRGAHRAAHGGRPRARTQRSKCEDHG